MFSIIALLTNEDNHISAKLNQINVIHYIALYILEKKK